jgi:hypothetical protein
MPHANRYSERPDIPGITQLVEEMRDFARKHPYNPESALKEVYVDPGCARDFEYQGVRLEILLSYNVHHDLNAWSLSVMRKDGQMMDDKWIEPLLTHFFEDAAIAGPVVANPPMPMVPHMKQYGQRIVE